MIDKAMIVAPSSLVKVTDHVDHFDNNVQTEFISCFTAHSMTVC